MFGRKIELLNIFGFSVKLHSSWIIIAVLIVWTLSANVFPYYYPDLSRPVYWIMALAGLIGLFFSITVHELCHSLVARKFGMPMKGITLFLFGGIAEMDEEPVSPEAEFSMALAGPLISLVLGFIFMWLALLSADRGTGKALSGILDYLKFINWVLAGFNLVPAFPLDGGRVLRSVLWKWKEDLKWATRISSIMGKAFGTLLILLGIFYIFLGVFINGMWWVLIGMFIRWISQLSYRRIIIREAFRGQPVKKFMSPSPVSVEPGMSVKELVEDNIYKYHHRIYPVVDTENNIKGMVSTSDINRIEKNRWQDVTVGELMREPAGGNMVGSDTDTSEVIKKMRSSGNTRFMVEKDGKIAGVITLKDIFHLLPFRTPSQDDA
jgi:Zn-dependent protease/predicted transcriptional regulator